MADDTRVAYLARLQEIKHGFAARGETISGWAERNGFRREEVYAMLAGRTRGRRGRAHALAVALGLKANPDQQ
jgi:gp16 family phage-associated protein